MPSKNTIDTVRYVYSPVSRAAKLKILATAYNSAFCSIRRQSRKYSPGSQLLSENISVKMGSSTLHAFCISCCLKRMQWDGYGDCAFSLSSIILLELQRLLISVL
jgi:hypothetical protein